MFDSLYVLEIGGSAAGAYAAKLFADSGAQVVRLEPAGGDPVRRDTVGDSSTSPVFVYLNTGKRAAELDRASLPGWLEWADVAIAVSANTRPRSHANCSA